MEKVLNKYFKEIGIILYDFETVIENSYSIDTLVNLKEATLLNLETLKQELITHRTSIISQFKDSDLVEIISERIDNLEDTIFELENIDIYWNEECKPDDLEEKKQILINCLKWEESNYLDMDEDDVILDIEDLFEEHYQELLEERIEEIKSALQSAVSRL